MNVVVHFLNLIVGTQDRRHPKKDKEKNNVNKARVSDSLSTLQKLSAAAIEEEYFHQDFWERHIYSGIVDRFGIVALKNSDFLSSKGTHIYICKNNDQR